MGIRRNKTILEQAADYVEAAVEKAGPVLADAKDKAGSALAEARDQAGPVLADARDKAGSALADARDQATPLLAQGASLAAEKASQGKELATAKAAELTGKPQKKKHRVRKLLIFTGIAAALGFVVKKLTSGGDKDNWQSSYTPTPPPRDADRTDAPIGDADQGGAGPGEALADATDEAHEVTTPDEPADVVDVSPGEEPVEKKSTKP
jgi:ElaB/YqjD/DUF883 family membrane-anchored ribosome-binding protein